MKIKYNHQKIEKKWQEVWEKTNLYHAEDEDKRDNFYSLVMYPYPSGALHLGHWYNFAGADFYTRYKRMSGYNVLSPIGFDSFGLPAENAAIKNNIHPKEWTYKNIETMIEQLKTMGPAYDWERMVITSDPEYYRWTQWMFLYMYKRGLAYKKKQVANWCPSCNNVLANEQVVAGKCWRCEADVIQKEIDQWLLKITDYADKLLAGHEEIDWPERTKEMQKNWIGRSEGAEVRFEVKGLSSNSQQPTANSELNVFTTRPDTLFGATFMVLAPEHPLVSEILTELKANSQKLKAIADYVQSANKKTELQRMEEGKDKTGVFSGLYAVNPVNNQEIPIWISDYVLMSYGHGAIMAVPAHDERDWDFAKKYKLPIIPVLEGGDVKKGPYLGDGDHINSDYLDGLNKEAAIKKVIEVLSKQKLAKKTVNYRLRDWLISRQRYWGAPIPIIQCEKCGEVSVPEEELPVRLPDDVKFKPTGESPLKYHNKFRITKCPICGGEAERETDTMDTFMCSSWYFYRYLDSKNEQEFCSKSKMKKWMPVDIYIGGPEHAVMHLLYSRFFAQALYDGGYSTVKEPFAKLRHQGMIVGEDGQKMSKSRGNVVDPDKEIKRVGADAVRLFIGFVGPFDQGGPWNPNGVTGCKRFLDKAWSLASDKLEDGEPDFAEARIIHKAIKKVGEDIEELKYNTAISTLMIAVNELGSTKKVTRKSIEALLLMLAPFAPHMTEELWEELGNKESIHIQSWPSYDKKLVVDDIVTVVVQVNGKVRANLEVSKGETQEKVEKLAFSDDNVQKFIDKASPKKIIYIQDKILNIVV
jgi:leucyl-tRNA synthetase